MGLLLTFCCSSSSWRRLAVIGLKFYVRPKEAIERVAGVAVDQREHIPSHPSLAFRQLLQKIGRCAACESEGRDHHAAAADSSRLPRTACVEGSVWFEACSRCDLLPILATVYIIRRRTWIRKERSWPSLLLRRPVSSGPTST